MLFVTYAAIFLIGDDGYSGLGRGFVEIDKIPAGISAIGAATLLGAIAFAGAGGAMNLVQSNWVREIGLRGGRLVVLAWAVLFYGGFSAVLVVDQARPCWARRIAARRYFPSRCFGQRGAGRTLADYAARSALVQLPAGAAR